jgi:hypothetical protein
MGKVDWAAVEKLLVGEATRQLAAFAAKHPHDVFYGAVFDVEPYDGCHVHLLLNTEAHLEQEHGKPVAADDLGSRFLPGSFEHTLKISKLDDFPGSAIEELIEADIDDDRIDDDGLYHTTAKLLATVCTVAMTLEHGALTALQRAPDFTIAVTPDPREPGDFSVARYARFKRAISAKRRSDPSLLRPRKPGI